MRGKGVVWRVTPQVVFSSAVFGVGLAATVLSLRMPWVYGGTLGPGFLPSMAAGTMSLCALLELVAHARRAKTCREPEPRPAGRPSTVLLLTISFTVYVLATQWLGLFLASTFLCLAVARLLSAEPWWKVVLLALAVASGTSLTFEMVFRLALPKGPLGF